ARVLPAHSLRSRLAARGRPGTVYRGCQGWAGGRPECTPRAARRVSVIVAGSPPSRYIMTTARWRGMGGFHTGVRRDNGKTMTEGQSVTAATARDPGTRAGSATAPGFRAAPAAAASASSAAPGAGAADPATAQGPPAVPAQASRPVAPSAPPATPSGFLQELARAADAGPHVRVDARHIESAILALRKPIGAAPLALDALGVADARSERVKLLSQIDDYLLPRLRESSAPILVALVGSTGAGKSTLVNSIVGAQVSMTGIRRPTTNSPVLACHPDDAGWFAENVFLPTVPRVRQEGLARSGRDGLLVLAASEGMPKGVALLDTPDIDSVVREHREFAHQFLDASD